MLSWLRKQLAGGEGVLGIDLGTHSARCVQLAKNDSSIELRDAVEVAVHGEGYNGMVDAFTRLSTVRPLATRKTIIGLPLAQLHIRHVRVPYANGDELNHAIRSELADALPIDIDAAQLRHVVAGEVQVGGNTQLEIIVYACEARLIQNLIAAAEAARLELTQLVVPPVAVTHCLKRLFTRKADESAVSMMIDLGHAATRAMVAYDGHLQFCRSIPHTVSMEQTQQPAHEQAAAIDSSGGVATLPAVASIKLAALVDELELCRRYHDVTFPQRPINRLMLFGGAAAERAVCHEIARGMNLPAQLADPIVRLNRDVLNEDASLDRRLPQPGWTNAISLAAEGLNS